MASMGSTKRKNKHKKQHTLSDIKTLGHQLLSSRAHVNNLPLLLTFANPNSPPEFILESLLSLHSFFTPLLPDLPSRSKSPAKPADQEDPEFIFRTWVRAKFDEFVQALIDLSLSPLSEEALREVVLDTLMESVKIGNRGKFHSAIYHRFIHAIVHCTLETDILSALLVSKYFKYIDVRYFTYISLEKLTKTLESEDISDENNANADSVDEGKSRSSRELVIRKLHHMLSNVPLPENLGEQSEYEMLNGLGVFTKEGNREEHVEISKTKEKHGKKNKSSSNVSPAANVPKKMKSKFTKAWISFLGLSLPVDVYKEVLVNLHHSVIPYLSNPIMLCDFLTRSYDIEGVISVMALSSLFVLMTEHGLEYPNFYEKLYMLLEPSIFIAKHRAKFFQLLDSCLKSPLLPAYLAASFTKKLSRLSLSAPPSGGLVIIALVHNLLRRHPSINCLVHREDCDDTAKDVAKAEHSTDETSNNMKGIDHFNNEERDLVKTNAMRSSLWEIDTLRHHYCPPVSRFVESLKNDLTVRSKTTEVAIKDFCSASYGTIFKEEMRRRIKQVPLSGNKPPTSLFSESDFPGWTFGSKDEAQADDNNKTTNLSEEQDSKRQRIEVS